ncbi:MAG: hypothetical protein FIA94_05125 [Nitrospirae bacterium]|nr:hypothetical protein [Nitrospirota bacterium]
MKQTALLLSAVCLMMVLTAGNASAKTLFVSDTTEISNADALTWVDAFSATIKLTTYDNQCVELRFSTEAKTDGSTLQPQIAFQALIDGVLANPAPAIEEIDFDPSEFGVYDTASFAWYVCGLNIGKHDVRVRFAPFNAGNTATLRSGTLIIEMAAGKFVF